MPTIKRRGLMPSTRPGVDTETEELVDFYHYILQSICGVDKPDHEKSDPQIKYKQELLGPEFIAGMPDRLVILRVSRQYPQWDQMSLSERGARIALYQIDNMLEVCAHHLNLQIRAKEEQKKKGGELTASILKGVQASAHSGQKVQSG
jgi:hypothetical protein